MELWLTVNGKRTCASAPLDPLTRAVVISPVYPAAGGA